MFFGKKDPDSRPSYSTHVGDWGVVIIAAILTMGAVYLFLSPEDYSADFIRAQKTISSIPQARRAQPPAHPGETEMMLFDGNKK